MQLSPTNDFIHLLSKGSWGIDEDIWIKSDDSFLRTTFTTEKHKIQEQHSGRIHGLFRRIVSYVDDENGWNITSLSMRQQITDEGNKRGGAFGVMDWDAEYLEISFAAKRLKADIYAPNYYAVECRSGKSIKSFAKIIKRIQNGTK